MHTDIRVKTHQSLAEQEARLLHAFIKVMAAENTGTIGWDGMDKTTREGLLASHALHALERNGGDGLWPDAHDEDVARALRQTRKAETGERTVIHFRPRRLNG